VNVPSQRPVPDCDRITVPVGHVGAGGGGAGACVGAGAAGATGAAVGAAVGVGSGDGLGTSDGDGLGRSDGLGDTTSATRGAGGAGDGVAPESARTMAPPASAPPVVEAAIATRCFRTRDVKLMLPS